MDVKQRGKLGQNFVNSKVDLGEDPNSKVA